MIDRSKCVVLAALVCALAVPVQAADPVADLIQQAGNAEDDAERLAHLEELQAWPGLDAQLKSELDRLVPVAEKWVTGTGSWLLFFSREVGSTEDYELGIAEDSPLYPIGCYYRARMMAWYTMEMGRVWMYADRRRAWLEKSRQLLEVAKAAFPQNRVIRMYLGEPFPPEKHYPAVPGAPEWAVYQRESLERLADIVEWWIDNRLQENGEFGGGWGDDCEMWRWWTPVLISFEEPKIAEGQAKFSRDLLSQPHLSEGYHSRVTDVEHSAEDGSDAMTPMMHLDPDNPEWQQRALRLAELMETVWTGRNERGYLQFKSSFFSVDKVDLTPSRACDTTWHPKAMQPALLYWQRTGDERIGELISTWMDTWVDAAAREERGKPAGVIPTGIHWPEGHIGGVLDTWWDPGNYPHEKLYHWPSAVTMVLNTLLLTYHMTGDEKYLEPIRSMAKMRLDYLSSPPRGELVQGTADWCASRMGFLSGTVARYRLLTGSTEFDDLLAKESSSYMAFRLRGEEKGVVDSLRHTAEALRINFPGYTSEVRWTDRVLRFPHIFRSEMIYEDAIPEIKTPSPLVLYSTTTGDPGDVEFFPLNAVRWLTPPRDIAALVAETGKDRFAAQLFHFGELPRPMWAELYLLEPGDYRLTLRTGSQARGGKVLTRDTVTVDGPRAGISFELPGQKLCTLLVESA